MANDNYDGLKKDGDLKLSEEDVSLLRYYQNTYGYLSPALLTRVFRGDGEAAYIAARIIEAHEGHFDPYSNSMDDIYDLIERSMDLGYDAPEEGPELDALNEAIRSYDIHRTSDDADKVPGQILFPADTDFDPAADGLTDPSEDAADYYLYMKDKYPYLSARLLVSAFNGDSRAASEISRMLDYESDSSEPTLSNERYGWMSISCDSSDWEEIAEKGISCISSSEGHEPPRDDVSLTNSAIDLLMSSVDNSTREDHIRQKRAYRYFKKAALMGNPKAQHFLAGCYLNGRGAAKDEIKGIQWLETAAALGYEEAIEDLYRIEPEKLRTAEMLMNRGPADQSEISAAEDTGSQQDTASDDTFSFEDLRPRFESETAFYNFKLAIQRGILPRERLTDAVLGTGDDPGYDAYYMAKALENDGDSFISLQEELYIKSAEYGYVPAYSKLASYYYGDGDVDCDEDEALKWARKGADCGDADCLYILGKLALDSYVEDEIPEGPFELLTRAAEKGHGGAMYELSDLYWAFSYKRLKGKTPMRNYRTAIDWLLKAKDAGYEPEDDVEIDYQLETMAEYVRNQDEDDRDPKIASLREKAESGDVRAQFELGQYHYSLASADKRHLREAEYWLSAAADSGDAEMQYALYDFLWHTASETWEFKPAVGWLQRAAAQGYTPAAYELAVLKHDYQYHELVEPDPYGAEKTLEGLAEDGFAPAYCRLGLWALETDGLGLTKPNYKKAVKWLEKTCEYDDKDLRPYFTLEKVKAALKDSKDKLKEEKAAQEKAETQKKTEAQENALTRQKKERSFDLSLFWEEHSLQCWGILAAIGVLAFKWLYTGLGGSVFGLFGKSTPTLPVHGFAHFLLMVLSVVGIFYCTFVAVSFAGMYIGLEGLLAYPAMFCALFILASKKYLIVNKITLIAVGVIIAIHLIAIIADKRS